MRPEENSSCFLKSFNVCYFLLTIFNQNVFCVMRGLKFFLNNESTTSARVLCPFLDTWGRTVILFCVSDSC